MNITNEYSALNYNITNIAFFQVINDGSIALTGYDINKYYQLVNNLVVIDRQDNIKFMQKIKVQSGRQA